MRHSIEDAPFFYAQYAKKCVILQQHGQRKKQRTNLQQGPQIV